jgi:hypothetical protein
MGMAESKSDPSARHINEHFEKSSESVASPINRLATFSKWLGASDHFGKAATRAWPEGGGKKMRTTS